MAEIDTVRRALNLEQMRLLGQSWGGRLAIEYLLTHPPGVVSVVLASTSASIPQFVAEAACLKAVKPPAIYPPCSAMRRRAISTIPTMKPPCGNFTSATSAVSTPGQSRSGHRRNLTGNAVYETMGGPNEFIMSGNLKDWDRIERLGEITVPTLITVGRYDEITPTCAETMQRRMPHTVQVFEQAPYGTLGGDRALSPGGRRFPDPR